jgi:ubiquinone/menaquinone biosynthesis C-methylase UbiE
MNTFDEGGAVLEKNAKVADMWSSGGRAYDVVSQGVSEGIRHCVMRLTPQKKERILDIATGTGLTARHISQSGAKVTGTDIAQGLLDAARQLADEEGLSIDWQLGDAEKLPFADASSTEAGRSRMDTAPVICPSPCPFKLAFFGRRMTRLVRRY